MLRPGKVQVVKSTELDEGTGQTEGMIRKGAIVAMSDHLCASGRSMFLDNFRRFCGMSIPYIVRMSNATEKKTQTVVSSSLKLYVQMMKASRAFKAIHVSNPSYSAARFHRVYL